MYSVYKHSFLKDGVKLNPRLVNRSIDRALRISNTDFFDCPPKFHRLCSEQPHIPVDNVDVVRRSEPFGNWALPKLYKELHSRDPIVALQAINTIGDLLHNPEKTFEAIGLKIVNRLGHLLMKTTNVAFQERILMVLFTIASQRLGRTEIINCAVLVDGFKDLLKSPDPNIRCKTAEVLERLSHSFTICCTLIEEGYIPVLIQHLTTDEHQIVTTHLKTLEQLFTHTSGQEEGICCDGFTKLIFLLDFGKPDIESLASNCLAMLISHPEGKKISQDLKLLEKLNHLLHSENRHVYTSAAKAIMFSTHSVASKHAAAALEGISERLLLLAHNIHPEVQMFAIKALCNIVEHPKVRADFVTNHLAEVENIRICNREEIKRYKEILLTLIKWKPWLG